MALHDPTVRIVRVGAADAVALADLMRGTFLAACGSPAPAEAVARHSARHCAPAVVARELADPANCCPVADAGSRWLGYAWPDAATPLPVKVQVPAILLRRFYLRPEAHGIGVSDLLLQSAAGLAAQCGTPSLWLGIRQHAGRAIRFYERRGFARLGAAPFALGDAVQQHWPMQCPVARGGSGDGQDEGCDHAPTLGAQHVERAGGRGVVHDLDADAAGQESGHEGSRREGLAAAGAEQYHFRVEGEQGGGLGRTERRGRRHRPRLDHAVDREDERGVEFAIDHHDAVRRASAYEQLTAPRLFDQLHVVQLFGSSIAGDSGLRR